MAPPAGIRIPVMRFGAEGQWWIDGGKIEHERSCEVLTKNLRLLEDGTFVTSIGREVAPVVVDDVAFFIHRAAIVDGAFVIHASDDSEETIAGAHLVLGLDGADRLYARVKGNLTWARFLRTAQLALNWEEGPSGIGLRVGDRIVVPQTR